MHQHINRPAPPVRRLRRIVAAAVVALTAAVALPLATAAPAAAITQCQGSSTYDWFSSCTYALPGETKTDDFVFHGLSANRFEVFTYVAPDGTILIRARQSFHVYDAHHRAYRETGSTWRYASESPNSEETRVWNEDGSFAFTEDHSSGETPVSVEFTWGAGYQSFTRAETQTTWTPDKTTTTTWYSEYTYNPSLRIYELDRSWGITSVTDPLFFRWR